MNKPSIKIDDLLHSLYVDDKCNIRSCNAFIENIVTSTSMNNLDKDQRRFKLKQKTVQFKNDGQTRIFFVIYDSVSQNETINFEKNNCITNATMENMIGILNNICEKINIV